MDKALPTIIVIVFTAVVLVGMYLGWRALQRRQVGIPRPRAVPADVGAPLQTTELLYVATTAAGDPLSRIAVGGLRYRGKASVTVAERGIVLAITGERDAFIPVQDLRSVGRATWAIDRAVETGGLVAVGWTLTDDEGHRADVDSYLRVVEPPNPSALIGAIAGLIETGNESES